MLERWRAELPTLGGLMERGLYGRLTSVVPPITVPAWSCMMASRTPGDLGIYGFRNRADHSYDALFVANGDAREGAAPLGLRDPERQALDRARRAGDVPAPAAQRRDGQLLPDALDESRYTYPPLLAREVEQVVGEYLFDCTNFRTDDKDDLLAQVYEMTDRRFKLADHLAADEAVGALRDGRDGARPDAPRVLEGRGATRRRDPRLLPPPRRARGRAARARRRRHGGARRLRPRREAAGRRGPHQRVAAPRGAPRARAPSRTAAPRSPRSGSTGPDDGLGRGRLLRAGLPQRARPRAAGDDRAGGLRARPRRAGGAARGDPRPRRRADRHARLPARRTSTTR